MTTTNNYGVTLLESSQAQKEITINEAFGVFDAVLKGVVLDKDLATPPASPAAGDSYLVAASPTGAWSGKAKYIAYYDQVWRFIAPLANMRLWVADEACYYGYNGTAWVVSNPTIGSISGNAATATALQTPRTINGVSFDGTANITITAAAGAGTLTGTTLAAGVTASSLTSVGTLTTGVWNATAIAAVNGGTGLTSYAVGDIPYASASTALSKLAGVATGNALISGGVATAPSWGKIGLGTHVSGTLPAANGGTGLASYTTGDIPYASASTTLSKLAGVATGNALISGGVGAAPSYGKIGLATHISGTLPVANGGTGDTGTAWTTYSPTVTAGAGSFTSVSATGRYKTLGKTVFLQITITITTNGTASSYIQVTAPMAGASFNYILNGRETAVTGYMLNTALVSGTSNIMITKYDASYIGANGYVFAISGMYEAA